ncbi:MAG: FAD-dependent oxidoreductase [Proteobacteria bacterium]|nr:FAD-dependent oxidoreductase [Pseudomonadota bacterium]
MKDVIEADLCVIGAGAAGLSIAAAGQQMGARVVLIEQGLMGGDCLNYGCVPSKALLACAAAAAAVNDALRFGVDAGPARIDPARVHRHVESVIQAIAPNDSVARFGGMGVRVLKAPGCFTGPAEVTADDTRVRARRFVLATGSRPMVPPIEGLDQVDYLTNETVFARPLAPDHLIVVGGGPIGIELAFAFRQLGARVTVIEAARILANDDPELVDLLRQRLVLAGIDIHEGSVVQKVERAPTGVQVLVKGTDDPPERRQSIAGSHLLIATGRRPTLDGLGLDRAGIRVDKGRLVLDARLRTTNLKVFAAGDVAGGPQFTHVAAYHAGIVLQNALFRWPAKIDLGALPWVTYTEPELAHVGLSEHDARRRGLDFRVLRWPLADNDRARTQGITHGLVKAVVAANGRVLGASILAPAAGELIQVWTLAVQHKLNIKALATAIAPYPTLGEASKRAAASYFQPMLFGDRTRAVVRFLARFG